MAIMKWKKDPGIKYTELCIYVDSQIQALGEGTASEEVENKVYNYLWLLIKALAIKKHLFNNFTDYDGYSFYAATRIFFALKRNYQNQGKVIRGKLIRPIKSCLNYTKALLYPMKIEYQQEAYAEILSEENINKKFDTLAFHEKLKDSVSNSQTSEAFKSLIKDVFSHGDIILQDILKSTPFKETSPEYKWLKMSIILNVQANIQAHKPLNFEMPSIILWHLPKSMQGYVRILIKEFCTRIKKEIAECSQYVSLDDSILNNMLKNPTGDKTDYESQY